MFFHALRGTCLLAALAAAGLWGRSHYTSDVYTWPVRGGGDGLERVHSRIVQTTPGKLLFQERSGIM